MLGRFHSPGARIVADFMPTSVRDIEPNGADTSERHREWTCDGVSFKQHFQGEEIPFKMGELIDSTNSVRTAAFTMDAMQSSESVP